MSKVTASTNFDQVADEGVELPQLKKFLAIFADQVVEVLTNKLDFETNFNCKLLSVTFSAANVNVAVNHGLGRVPTGYIVYQRSANLVVFDGSANTSTFLNLQASTAGTVSVIVF
jgi:hypothetical protein